MKSLLARRVVWTLLACVLVPAAWPAASARAQEVDAALKKLMAASGLFRRGLYKPAANEFTDFLAKYPTHAEVTTARYGLAICHYRLGEYDKAAARLQETLKNAAFKQRDEALAVLGHCHLSLKAHAKALATFDELLTKHAASKHAELAALNRAQVLYLLDRKTESLAACQAFLKKYPNSGRRVAAEYFLALAQEGLGKHPEAVATLTNLLKAHPNNPYELDATLLMGQALEGQGKLPEAIVHYQKFIKAAPPARQPEGLYSLGVALYKAGKHAESMKQLTLVLTKHGKSRYAAPGRLQLGLAQLAVSKPAEARKTLTAVVRADPARATSAKYWLAQCDVAEKKYPAALAGLQALAALKPPPANLEAVLFDRAVCLMAMGKHTEAVAGFQAFAASYPKSPQIADATYRRAFCLHKLEKYAESLALCRAVGESAAKGPAAELAAENLFLMGKYPESQQAFANLAKTAKAPEQKLRNSFRLGQCAYFTGDYAKAIQLLQPVAASPAAGKDEELLEAVFLMGDAQLQTGAHAAAAGTLARYVAATKRDKQEAQFKLALAQLRGGNAAAAKTLSAVMAGPVTSPWVLRALFEYGQLTYKQKQPAKAAAALAKVVAAKAPPELQAPAIYLLGWIDFDAKKYDPAAARFGEVLQKFPTHALAADACFQQALSLKEAGKTQPALAALQAYVAKYPTGKHAGEARHLVGTCLAGLNRHAEAIKALTALAGNKSTCTDAVLYELAWSHRSVKDAKSAGATYQRLLAEFPKSELAIAGRAELAELLYQDKKYAEAATLLEKALADTKADPKTAKVPGYRLGWCYVKLENHAKAAQAFANFVARYGKDELAPSAMYQAGLAYALSNKHPEATRHFSKLLAEHPTHELAPVTYLKLGEVQNASSNYAGSGATFQAFLTKYPKDKFVYLAEFGMGWSLESLKKLKEARAWYTKVTDKHNGPTAARAQFQIGETFFAEGKFDEAAQELLKVDIIYAYPEWSARALYEAGMAFEQLKQADHAKSQYSLCVKKFKDEPAAKLCEARLKALGSAAP